MNTSHNTSHTTSLSDHFSLAEALASETAERMNLMNTPDDTATSVMYRTAIAMERVRLVLGNKSIHINSWYRCLLLNRALSSKDSSQHLKGEAVDFICPAFGDPLAICRALIAAYDSIRFDQLILEHSWVHISFAISTGKPRKQVLSLLSNGGYAVGLTNKEGTSYE
jgi:hypothetical protein